MSVLLTLSQPTSETATLGQRGGIHDFSPRISHPKSRVSPRPFKRESSPVTSLRASDIIMTTPHRGLPPPSAMNLPDPSRHPPPAPPPPLAQPLGSMPAPPLSWQGQEESMRNWLVAKAEEDKRKQEEEKTRQEQLRLEQRRIEQSMLRESLQGGVPPQLVPMIYAGVGGANLAQVSIDWLQQYASQLQAAQHQQIQQTSPEMSREPRLITQGPPSYHASPQQIQQQQVQPQIITSQPAESTSREGSRMQPTTTTFSAYQPPGRPAPTSAPRSATHTSLPRLTTNEMYIHTPPQNPGSAHPLQQSQSISDQTNSSPSIYFHHWVPPSESSKGVPQTPAGKAGNEPSSAHPGPGSHEGEYKDSPRKRKAQGGHHANPPPSAGPQYTSPSFSSTSSTPGRKAGHQRSRSNASVKDYDTRPDSRREQEASRAAQLSHAHILSHPPQRLNASEERQRSSRPESRQSEEGQHRSTTQQPEDPGPSREFRVERPGGTSQNQHR